MSTGEGSADASQDTPGATENQQTAHGEGTWAAAAQQEPGNWISWLVLQRVVNNMKKYPFLQDDNYKDILLVHQVLHNKPYRAAHGQVIAAWETLAIMLNNATADDGSKPFEMYNLRGRAVRDRFATKNQ